MNKKVMVVEDESIVAMELSSYVTELGYMVVGRASNGDDAYAMAQRSRPDVILMDVHLKGNEDGISLVQRLQAVQKVAIIYITAFNDEMSIQRAVETAPAAYLTKPFNRRELAAALMMATHSVDRKADAYLGETEPVPMDDEFSFDAQSGQLYCNGISVHLTRKERELLLLLIKAKGQVVDIYSIENTIWPGKNINESTRRGLVARLRAKLKYKFIETVQGQGYSLNY